MVNQPNELCDLKRVCAVNINTATGTRKKRGRQRDLWIASGEVVRVSGNALYDRLNNILDQHNLDRRTEHLCRKSYKKNPYGRRRLCSRGGP